MKPTPLLLLCIIGCIFLTSCRAPVSTPTPTAPVKPRLIHLPDLSVAEYDWVGAVTGRSFTWSSDSSRIIFTDALAQRLLAFDLVHEEIRQISGEHAILRWWTGAGTALPSVLM